MSSGRSHHDVRCRVRADARKLEQSRGDLVVIELVVSGERFEVELAGGDGARERAEYAAR